MGTVVTRVTHSLYGRKAAAGLLRQRRSRPKGAVRPVRPRSRHGELAFSTRCKLGRAVGYDDVAVREVCLQLVEEAGEDALLAPIERQRAHLGRMYGRLAAAAAELQYSSQSPLSCL